MAAVFPAFSYGVAGDSTANGRAARNCLVNSAGECEIAPPTSVGQPTCDAIPIYPRRRRSFMVQFNVELHAVKQITALAISEVGWNPH